MDKIILGYLMLRGMSAYDLKTCIKKNLSSMCSASSGSLYAALNKLKAGGLIEEDKTEAARDKKMYSITSKGRTTFMEWISMPMSSDKVKNIEMAKLFFGGIQDKATLINALNGYVKNLENEHKELMEIKKINDSMSKEAIQNMINNLSNDPYNKEGIKALNSNVSESQIKQIYENQMRTLSFGIAHTEFQIDWFKKEISKIEKEN